MEGQVLLEQLVGIILIGLSLFVTFGGWILYTTSRLVGPKFSELRLETNNYIRYVLHPLIRSLYKTSMFWATVAQAVIDAISFAEMYKEFREARIEAQLEKEFKEFLGEDIGIVMVGERVIGLERFFEWVDEMVYPIKARLKRVGKKIVCRIPRIGWTRLARELGYRVGYEVITNKRVIAELSSSLVGLVVMRYISKNVNYPGMPYWEFFLIRGAASIVFGNFVQDMTELIFRSSVPLLDRILYTNVNEFIKGPNLEKKIANRISWCWKAFGKGEWDINYLRGNPVICSVSHITGKDSPNLTEIILEMRKIEEEYLNKNQKFFSNGRFVFTVEECNMDMESCTVKSVVTCYGPFDCRGGPTGVDVLSSHNITVTVDKNPINVSSHIGIMHIAFAECVPWDSETGEVRKLTISKDKNGYLWPEDRLGSHTVGETALAFYLGEGVLELHCEKPDTLYITFIKIKEDNIKVVVE